MMENIEDKINFIKWQLLSRLPKGSIYERVFCSLMNNILENDPFYYIYWLDIDKSLLEKYLLGTYCTSNDDYEKFILWLDGLYKKDGFYEILVDGINIKISCPEREDYKCFKAEFLDIIMPYIVKNRNLKQPFLEGPYEFGNVKLNSEDVVFDLGANFGLFSSLAIAKGCDVYAFEPTFRVYSQYLMKLLDENIHVYNDAISNVTGNSLFKCFKDKSSCNRLYNEFDKKEDCLMPVSTITVDDFVLKKGLNKVDFIKADIEGAERLMLDGARMTLREFAPNLAICYYHKLDDLKVLRNKIMEANPKYEIDVAYKKIYAHVPGRNNK